MFVPVQKLQKMASFFALFLTLQGLFYDKGTEAIVMLGSWGACLQLMLNNAYLGRCITCCRETRCWEERAHGNSSTDTTLFPESSFALWGAGEQVATLNQQSTAKFSVSPFWKGIDLVCVSERGRGWGEETVALGPTPLPCRLVPLPLEAMVSPRQPVLANQRMPWSSDSSFIYRIGKYGIDLLEHCARQRGFQKPSFLRVSVPFRWQNNCKFPVSFHSCRGTEVLIYTCIILE